MTIFAEVRSNKKEDYYECISVELTIQQWSTYTFCTDYFNSVWDYICRRVEDALIEEYGEEAAYNLDWYIDRILRD